MQEVAELQRTLNTLTPMKVLSQTVVDRVQSIYGKFTIAGVDTGTDIEFVILFVQLNESLQLIAI
jgi:hypothetical protein